MATAYADDFISSKFDIGTTPILLDAVDERKELRGQCRFSGGVTDKVEYNLPSEKLYAERPSSYWVMRHVLSLEHELCHRQDFDGIFARQNSDKAMFASMLNLVSSQNEGFSLGKNGTNHNLANYAHDINEIRSEYGGYLATKEDMLKRFGTEYKDHIDAILIDIMNDKIEETHGHYCICDGRKRNIRSWDQFVELAYDSAEKAYKRPFVYDLKENYGRDVLANVMLDKIDKSKVFLYKSCRDPYEQIRMLSIFVLTAEPISVKNSYHITP